MKHTYGLKSIAIAGIGHPHVKVHADVPQISFMPPNEPVNASFTIDKPDGKTMRLLFGNKWNKPVSMGVYKFKIKKKAFARPVYLRFVYPRYSFKQKSAYKSLSEFVKEVYS